jgi:hypothetical protein
VYYLVSNSSGYVKTKCGDVYGNIRIVMLVFLGVISGLDPIIDFDGCSIEGFCLYVVAQQI